MYIITKLVVYTQSRKFVLNIINIDIFVNYKGYLPVILVSIASIVFTDSFNTIDIYCIIWIIFVKSIVIAGISFFVVVEIYKIYRENRLTIIF